MKTPTADQVRAYLAEGFTFPAIARKHGVAPATITRLAKRNAIPPPPRPAKLPPPDELLQLLTVETATQIAARYGTSKWSVNDKIDRARKAGRLPALDTTPPPPPPDPINRPTAADWDLAPCRQIDPNAMFPEFRAVSHGGAWPTHPGTVTAVLKQTCDVCPLRNPCLRGALNRGEPHGIWGGTAVLAGKPYAIKRIRRAAR